MMQTLDQGDQEVQVSHATKGDKQPCAWLSDVYQKEELKSDIKRAFESRNSYSHGTNALQQFMFQTLKCKIEALGQCIPPPRHVLPVSRGHAI